jgi:uncharacterized glyoxalase superfamily protein PhnB
LGRGRPRARLHLCELSDHHIEPGSTGITLLTDDALSDCRRPKAKGVRFLSESQKMDWGEWLCDFDDPDGNEFSLKQPAED